MTEPAAANMATWSHPSVARGFCLPPRKRELRASLVNRGGVPTWRNGPGPCRSRKRPPNNAVNATVLASRRLQIKRRASRPARYRERRLIPG